LLVHFEKFLTKPDIELAKVCSFLDIEFTHKADIISNAVPEWELKWKSESMKSIDVSKIYAWKAKLNNENVGVANLVSSTCLKEMGFPSHKINMSIKNKLKAVIYKNSLVHKLLLSKRLG
jgi:hypothetical protein